jgi:hypothetical protein
MKKSQYNNLFIIIVVVIIAISLIFFGKYSLSSIKEYSTKRELNNFIISINNKLKEFPTKHDQGSVKQFLFSLPREINSICLVDRNKKINNFINNELAYKINNFKEENLFLSPYNKFFSYKITDFILNESENPLCIETSNGKISFKFENLGNTTLIKALSPSYREIECVDIIYNGNPYDKIDIVFLGDGYSDITDLSKDTNDYINNVLFKIEPFNNSIDKFNIYRIDKKQELGCSINNYIKCNEFNIKEAASSCPHDYIFILVNRNKIKDFIKPIRSSAISNMVKINTADKNLVLVHEFGHIFANLADEYVDEGYYQGFNAKDYPNCDTDGCPKWSLLNLGCFQGCSLHNFYRATENSIMKNYYKSNEFGALNSNIINKKIEVYS